MKLLKPNSKKVHAVLMKLKIAAAALAVSSYGMSHEKVGFWMLVTSFVVEIIAGLFSTDAEV